MYYGELSRIKRMQKLLNRVAYISVGTDFLIAISTYLVINNVPFSSSALLISDYVDFVMVAVIATIFLFLLIIKYPGYLMRRARVAAFKFSH